jgi:hypothetical protein
LNENVRKVVKGKKNPPKKGKAGLIIIITLAVIIGAAILLVGLNLFGVRDSMADYFRGAPLIGRFIPDAPLEYDGIPLEEMSPHELANIVRTLEAEIAAVEARLAEAADQARADALRIARLLPFYTEWVEYQRVIAEFNAMIALGDPEAYLRFIESILPEFYEQLARDAMLLYQYQTTVMEIVRTLSNMQEGNAAAVLEDLRITDILLLTAVIREMSTSLRGAILDEMDSDIAAFMLRLISVPEPVVTPLAPALHTPDLPETYEDIEPDEYYEDENEE